METMKTNFLFPKYEGHFQQVSHFPILHIFEYFYFELIVYSKHHYRIVNFYVHKKASF